MNRPRGRMAGFSLLELLFAVAVTLVILTFALPGWNEYRWRLERVEATRLLSRALDCERSRTFLGAPVNPNDCRPADSRAYRFFRSPGAKGSWRAEPRGGQRGDHCGTLLLSHGGDRRALGRGADPQRCWRGR